MNVRAWLAAAITALKIVCTPVNVSQSEMWNYLIDPLDVVYTYSEMQNDEYLDRQLIQITPEATIIDGIVYDDIWISHDAADKFRTNAFDFQTAYNIASDDSGTFVSGAGTVLGVPVFEDGSYIKSQIYELNWPGTFDFAKGSGWTELVSSSNPYHISYQGLNAVSPNSISSRYQRGISIASNPNSRTQFHVKYGSEGGNNLYTVDASEIVLNGFDFDYVSRTIPAPDPLSPEDGMLIHLPHSPDIDDFVSDNPEFLDPDNEIDISLPDISAKLGELGDIIIPLIPIANVEFAPQPAAPYSGPISDAPWSGLERWLSDLKNSISSLGDTILQDIELGPIRIFDKVLDLISTAFASVFSLIRSGLGVWHYVVDWFSFLSAPLSFMVSVLPSGIWTPVFALVAGSLVIAIWRRFGR